MIASLRKNRLSIFMILWTDRTKRKKRSRKRRIELPLCYAQAQSYT
ncbi:hypothetical protein ACT7DA_20925 [Bacillus pacificus]